MLPRSINGPLGCTVEVQVADQRMVQSFIALCQREVDISNPSSNTNTSDISTTIPSPNNHPLAYRRQFRDKALLVVYDPQRNVLHVHVHSSTRSTLEDVE